MAGSRHVLRRIARRYQQHGVTARDALVLIVIVTTTVTVVAGVVIWLVDGTAFPTVGAGLWWALGYVAPRPCGSLTRQGGRDVRG